MSQNLPSTSKKRRRTILAAPVLLVILSLACALPSLRKPGATPASPTARPTASPQPTPTQRALPPALIESTPSPGTEIPLQGLITLYFNQPMDRASVEAALKARAFLIRDLVWSDDATLSIDPGLELAPDSELAVEVETQARAANGLALQEPISLTYRTVGYLQLAQRLPEPGAAEVSPDSALVATFSHPVVPLGADPAILAPAFSLEPAASGRGEWINTSTYIFYPEPALEGGKAYTVQVDPNLHGIDGNPLAQAESWTFTTAVPRIEVTVPAEDNPTLLLDGPVEFIFNQPMDSASVEANFRLLDPAGTPLPGQFEWRDSNRSFTWKPDSLLARSTPYTIELDGQAQARGGTPLGETYRASYTSIPELQVIRSQPAQGGVLEQYHSISLYMSGPVEQKNVSELVTIEPRVPNLNGYWNEATNSFDIYGDFKPSTDYRLSLSPELSDPWGSTLGGASGEPYTLDFRSAPLPPAAMVGAGGAEHFLTPQDNALVAQVSGLTSLPVSLGSLPLDDFIRMMGPDSYEYRNSYRPVDERSWVQSIEADPDRADLTRIYLTPAQTPLPSGLYFMRLTLPGDIPNPASHVISVSDVHLTFKLSATDALVWAVDLRSGAPVADAPVKIYDWNGDTLAFGQTDAQGIFRSAIPERKEPYYAAVAVLGEPGGENFAVTGSEWSRDVEPWSFSLSTDFQGARRMAYLYTDRPIYRPGQPVYFRAVVREAYNGRYQILPLQSLTVKLHDDYGHEIDSQEIPLSTFGTLSGKFVLPENLRPGAYSLNIPELDYTSIAVPVADYRKPEIDLQASFSEDELLTGEALQANLAARYFFDAPAGNVPVEWYLYATPTGFDLPGYAVGLQGASRQYGAPRGMFGSLVSQGSGVTQPDGTLVLDLGLVEPDPERQLYTLEVTAKDESGLPVSARGEAAANPEKYFIGVRADSWLGREGEPQGFETQTVDWEGMPVGGQALRAEFAKVTWVPDESIGPVYAIGTVYKPEFELIASTDFRSGADGKARVEFTPPEPGPYQLSVFSQPGNGQNARSEILTWVGGQGQFLLPQPYNRHIELTADQTEYQPGMTARVFVPNPFSGDTPALVTVERAKVLSHQVQTLVPGGTTLEFPLNGDDAPNIFVSVTLLGRDANGQPNFRQGYIELPVEPVEQALNVEITRTPEVTGPGETVEFEIQVSDSAGNPVQGEFSLAVADMAALALADPNSVDILPAFYGKQPLGVRSAVPLSVYAALEIERPFANGMGGGGDGGYPTVRERFPDTAYWQGDIVTDAEGKARISVPLPDSLTTWQAETRGLTADTRVGQAKTQVVTTKDLIVRPVTPRFLVAGDRVQLAAIIQNNTDEALLGEATLQATGFELDDPAGASQAVSIPANGRVRLDWWGQAGEGPEVELTFSASAKGGALQDAARPALGDLPVLRYSAPQTFRTAGTLDEAGQRLELVSVPRFAAQAETGSPVQGGALTVELSPSLAAAMLQALQVLEADECLCTELTISRFLPNLEIYRTFGQFGLQPPDGQANLERELDEGLKVLLNRQSYDGGWGWWPGSESDPFMTTYALHALTRARGAGLSPVETPIQLAVEYLKTNLIAQPLPNETWQLDRLAFAHYALANADAGDLEGMLSVFAERASLSPWGQALLALALERSAPGSPEADTLISDLQATAARTAAGAHWELAPGNQINMVSTLTNSAIVTYVLAQRDPGSPLVAEAVRYLTANRQADGGWTSSYTTAWTLMALNEVLKATGELGGEYTFGAALNDAPLASGQAGGTGQLNTASASLPLAGLYPDTPNLLAIERGPGGGRLYYSARLDVSRPAEQAPALAQGLALTRQYFPAALDCTQEPCSPIETAQAGEKVAVRLTLTVPRDSYYVMVEDFIPAGAEILDTRLKTSQLGEGGGPEVEQQYDPADPFADGWGWWYFNEAAIYDDHIAWSADTLPAGTYELTYSFVPLQAGDFQVLPAHAWQLYFPEVQATSEGGKFGIR